MLLIRMMKKTGLSRLSIGWNLQGRVKYLFSVVFLPVKAH